MRITIKAKLAAAFGFVILLMAGMAMLGISSLGTLNATLERTLDGPVVRAERSQAIRSELALLVRTEKNLILASEPAAIAQYEAEMLPQRQALAALIDSSIATASEQGRPRWVATRAALQNYMQVQDRIREAVRSGDNAQAVALQLAGNGVEQFGRVAVAVGGGLAQLRLFGCVLLYYSHGHSPCLR